MVYEEYARELYNNRGYVFGNTTLHYCESEIYAIKDGDNIILTHAKSPAEAHRNVNKGLNYSESYKSTVIDKKDEYNRLLNNMEWLMQKADDLQDKKMAEKIYDLQTYLGEKVLMNIQY